MKKKTVLIIFKTHLDIGFTDYAENVVANYLDCFIPNAIKVGYELKDSDTPFIWTTGAWLIDLALKKDSSGMVENAIRDGILNWHALPFTTHTELMSPELFEYALGISRKLDERFGVKTIGAKMTDVPGHTIGMVPYLKKYGVKFLHLGINPVAAKPQVPSVFRWKCGEDSIVVMYDSDYGNVAEFDDFIVYFAHTNDNCGPQSVEEIINIYKNARVQFPEHTIRAATLNDLAEFACKLDKIPILEKEIGDTWIHGAGTDPQKMSRYRRILREVPKDTLFNSDLTDNLLLIPEHTWGMDVKTYFKDTTHWNYTDIESCAERNTIEESWNEQCYYVEKAEKLFGFDSEYPISEPSLNNLKSCTLPENNEFEISWQLFANADYDRYKKQYLRLTDLSMDWGTWDNIKVGLPNYDGGIFTAKITKCYKKGSSYLYKLEFDNDIAEKHGLPYFWAEKSDNMLSLWWFGKRASRLPQAFWLKFNGYDENWEINKLGQWIRPDMIADSPLICATYAGVRNKDVQICPLDSPLVAPYGRKLLHYGERPANQDMYFNLYNNIWNTNFPMWYSGEAMFRFEISNS